jgi:hypothetical protein
VSSRCHFICREPISVDARQVYRPRCIPESKNVPDPCLAAALSPVLVVSRSLGCNMHNIYCQVSNRISVGCRTPRTSCPQNPSPNLALRAPDALQEPVALCEAVEGVVALAHGADEPGEGIGDVLALDGAAVLIDLGDGDLAGPVVLGLDDAARRRALAGDVTGGASVSTRSCALPGSSGDSQVNDLATVVLHFDGGEGWCCGEVWCCCGTWRRC